MKIYFYLVIAFTIMCKVSYSQQIEIYGYVYDKNSGEKLIGANIFDSLSNNGVSSNAYGFYTLSIAPNSYIYIQASYVGYETYTQEIQVGTSQHIDIYLIPGIRLEKVEVRSVKPIEQRLEVGQHVLTPHTLKMLPAATGESDVFKSIQLLPGVQSGNEGTNGLIVRGGSTDQNLVMLDGVALYNTSHLGGFVSMFHTDILKSVTVIKGGFPARYGGRLSSVVDVRTKDGNITKPIRYIQLGLLNTSLYLEGPIKKDTSSYFISVRRSPFDILVYRPLSYLYFKDFIFYYTFYDIHVKYNYKFSPKSRLFVSSYYGKDLMVTRTKRNKDYYNSRSGFNVKWGNAFTSAKYNHIISPRLHGNILVSISQYKLKTQEWSNGNNFENNAQLESKISDIQCMSDFEYTANRIWQISFGGGIVYHNFVPVSVLITEKNFDTNESFEHIGYSPKAIEPIAFIENKINTKRFQANVGIRYTNYIVNTSSFACFEPRAIINIPLPQQSSIKLSYAKMQQAIHFLTNSGFGMPVDYWIPATQALPPSTSEQISIAWVKTYKTDYEISIDMYAKHMNNLVELKPGVNLVGYNSDWQLDIEPNGKGKAYGVECMVEKKVGKHRGWMSYTLAKTTRQFKNINYGEVYPFKYDRRNDVSIVYMYEIKKNWDFSATWVYGTGNAITLAQAQYSIIDDYDMYHIQKSPDEVTNMELRSAHVYGKKNSYRMRDYHRLDIGVNHIKEKKRGEVRWSFNIYNVYARQNPYYYFWDDQNHDNINELYQFSLFGFTPSISYGFYF